MSKMFCFYHGSDLDGKCSGAIVAMAYGWDKVDLRPINYNDTFPWDEIQPDDTVFMVDFGLQPFSDMIRLNALCNLVWIDHHVTAINNYEEYMEGRDEQMYGIKGYRKVGDAGCELTWKFFEGDAHMSKPIYLMGRYDVWKHHDIPHALPFQYGMKLIKDTHPTNKELWEKLIIGTDDVFINDIINKGELLLQYERNQNASLCRYMTFETEFEGLKCIGMNKQPASSQIFESVWDSEKYDAMIAFARTKGKWTVSMYSDKEGINVGEICKKHGGGGHAGAAGFSCDKIPFSC